MNLIKKILSRPKVAPIKEVIDLLLTRKFKEACLTMATYESKQIIPRGMGIDWKNYDSTRDEKILDLIFNDLTSNADIKIVASVIHLFGNPNLSFFKSNNIKFEEELFKQGHKLCLQILRLENTEDYLKQSTDSSSVINGIEFFATLQLRTPLKVLIQHGSTHTDRNNPPKFTEEAWMGMWLPKLKSFKELGIDMPEMPETTVSSDIGYVYPSKFIKFLIAFREIVESDLSINDKIENIKKLQYKSDEFNEYYSKFLKNDADFPSSFFYT